MVLRRRNRLAAVVLGAALILAVGLIGTGQASHLRPKSATVVREALIPGHVPCTSPNKVHSPSLAFPSCNPPLGVSPLMETGTPDHNTIPANMASFVRLDIIPSDLQIQAVLNDQYCTVGFTGPCTNTSEARDDYVGGLNVHIDFRVTDHWNANTGSGPFTQTATVADFPIDWGVSCVAMGGGPPGGQCNAITTINSLIPGAMVAAKRMSWEVAQLYVQDGGTDGNPATAPNNPWMVRGLFQP